MNKMKIKILTLLLTIVVFGNVSGQNYLEGVIAKDSALQDFSVFKSALLTGHPSLYWFNDSLAISRSLSNAESQITENLTNKKFHSILSNVMNDVSCGHSYLLYPETYARKFDTSSIYLPFLITEIDNKLFVTKVFDKSGIAVGSKIAAINNQTTSEILAVVKSKIPTDKGISSKKERSLDILFSYYYSIYVDNSGEYSLEILKPNGEKDELIVDGISWDNDHMFHSLRGYGESRYPIQFEINNNIAELTLRSFGMKIFKKNGIDFEDTLSNIFQTLSKRNIDNLIIDLRGNVGGSLFSGELLLSYLSATPIKYYKNNVIREAIGEGKFEYADLPRFLDFFEEEYGELERIGIHYIIPREDSIEINKPDFSGHVFFLSDGLTFSSTSNFLAVCSRNNIGTLIGETPGGAYSGGNGGGPTQITLPNSKFRLFFYLIGINLNVEDNRDSIEVDHKVTLSINEIINGVDLQKEYVINLIENNIPKK